uniref:Protein gravitropic in the light 1 n=1 Tax=Tanacetum cinerariifolium TaxID=118510 RepID=A0A699JAT2_TANCI|nr:protein gravitropic in the light 1 [Tanacetum cinerariifolium]
MEGVVVKPSKHSPNISDIVSKFAKVCKFRSIGVFSSENPNFQEVCNDVEECVNGVAKADSDGAKVFVDMVEVCGKSGWSGHDEIIQLFDILSEVKLAYVKLQEAHIPYDVEKIRVADEAVLANLDGLCKVRRAFKEKQFQKSNSFSACLTVLRGEIKVQERLLEKLKAQAKKKGVQISYLKGELCDLDEKNRMLVEEIKHRKREEIKRLNLSSVENVINEVAKGIHDFAKPLIALMKASGWDLDEAANAIQDSVVYSVRSHKKYAFEAYITRRMFNGFSLKCHNVDDVLRFNDPLDVLIEDPNGSFAEFCKIKYLLIVHPRIEASFFGHLDQRNFVSSGRHPMTPFYQLFVKMARWVWILQGIAASEPQSEMFVVNRGTVFCDNYMQNIERCKDDDDMGSFDKLHGMYKVELMVMPGFRIGDKLYKSRVYLSRLSNTS